MRVLTVCPSLDVGGLERIAVDLANALAARGAELAFAAADGPLAAGLDPRVRRIPLRRARAGRAPRSRRPRPRPGSRARCGRCARTSSTPTTCKITGVAGVGLRLAGVRRPRAGRDLPRRRRPARTAPRALVLRAASEVVCVSEGLAERLREAGGSRTDLGDPQRGRARRAARPRRARPDRRRAGPRGAAGRGVGRAADARQGARAVPRDGAPGRRGGARGGVPHGRRRAAAGGARAGAPQGLASASRAGGADARELIARADVLVVSSDSEGLSVVALEALSAGVPVVTTPVTGMAELLGAAAASWPSGPTPALLAGAVVSLLRDPAARGGHGEAGRELVARRYGLARWSTPTRRCSSVSR